MLRLPVFTILGLLIFTGNALACSESLYRIGHDVRYREYTAPIPGNVLVIAQTQAEKEFADWLASTGHNVQTVDDPEAISSYLESNSYDVVLGHFSDHETIDAQRAAVRSNAAFIPVVADGSQEETAAKLIYERTLTSNAEGKDYLKAIHKTLKSVNRKRSDI